MLAIYRKVFLLIARSIAVELKLAPNHEFSKGGNMDFELKPHTEAGIAFVTLAEQHAEEFAGAPSSMIGPIPSRRKISLRSSRVATWQPQCRASWAGSG